MAILIAAMMAFSSVGQAMAAETAAESVTEPPAEVAADVTTESPTEAPTETPAEPPTEVPTEAPTEPETEAPTEPPTEAHTEAPTEPETVGFDFYAGYWNCTGVDEGNGVMTEAVDGIPVADLNILQMSLYEDATVLFLTTDMEASGQWEETTEGILLTLQPYGGSVFQLEAVYTDGLLMLKDGPGTYRMVRVSEGIPVREVECLTIPFGGEGYSVENDAWNLGFDLNYFPVSLMYSDVDVTVAGNYTVIYEITDPVIMKTFQVIRPVSVESAPETEPPTELVTEPVSELVTEAPTEPVTELPETETVTEISTEPVSEPMTEAPTEPVMEPPETEAVTEASTEPISEPVTEAPTEPVTETPETEVVTEVPTEPVSEAVTETLTEPVTELLETEAVTETSTEPVSEPEPVTEAAADIPENEDEIQDQAEELPEEIPEEPKLGSLTVKKQDALTGTEIPVNENYSMEGAEYTLYADADCTNAISSRTIRDGKAVFEDVAYGDYFLKETAAPDNYELDEMLYPITISDETIDPVVISTEMPKQISLRVQAVDAETGLPEAMTAAWNLKGAVFGIYRDSAFTDMVEEIQTDENGLAVSSPLVIGNYYVKQTGASKGYNITDETFYITPEEMKAEISKGEEASLKLTAKQQIIRGDLMLLNSQDEAQPGGEGPDGIKFTLTYVDDPTVTFDVCGEENTIITDKKGAATTEKKEVYPRGTLIYGKWKVSQPSQEGIQEPIRDFVIEITEDGKTYPYTIHNALVQARVEIQMLDEETGNRILVEGAEIQIRDSAGKAVTMWNPSTGKYQDSFKTGEDGTIRLPNTLAYGRYTVEETKAPKGYQKAALAAFEVTESHHDPLAPLIVECSHAPQRGQITLEIADTDTGKTAGAGFVYQVTAAEDILDASGDIRTGENADGEEVSLIKGTVVDTITTDETGTSATKELYLGKYCLVEQASADYYAADQTEILAELKADSKNDTAALKVSAKNRKTRIEVSKVDVYDNLKPLAGITFRIFTDADADAGKVVAYNQKLSEFTASQAEALNAMLSEQEERYQTLLSTQEESLATYQAENPAEEDLNAFKDTQANTLEQALGEAESEAEMFLAQQETTLAAFLTDLQTSMQLASIGKEYETDKNGKIRMENLKHGTTYYVVETKTLPGYNLDPKVYEIPVDEHGLIAGEAEYFLALSNAPNVVQFSLKDEGMQELPGAKMVLLDSKGSEVHAWTTTAEPYGIFGLASGEYTLKELEAPEGYALADTVSFTVADQEDVQRIVMNCEKIRVSLSLTDKFSGQPVKGARLLICAEDGRKIGEWTTDGTAHVIPMNAGNYILSETETPGGYATAEPLAFRVTSEESLQTVEMMETPLTLAVHMKAEDGAELPGAVLSLLDGEGKEVEAWTTQNEAHVIRYLSEGTYTLKQLSAPAGYSLGKDVTFTLQNTEKEQSVNMTSAKTDVEILVLDLTTGENLPGAEMSVKDGQGNEADHWISDGMLHVITGLAAGNYTLTEIKTPAGYATGADAAFTVTDAPGSIPVVMENDVLKVSISRIDAATGKTVAGAEIAVRDSKGTLLEQWITTEEPHLLTKIPTGEYVLEELSAPKGYGKAAGVTFFVKDTKDIQTIALESGQTQVEISKKDAAGGTFLSGAKLKVLDENGDEKDSWTTEDKPHRISGLDAGNYFLIEETAPSRYARAASVAFHVTDSLEVQPVEILGQPTKVEIRLMDAGKKNLLPGAELTVTDANGEIKDSWTTEDTAHVIDGLPVGIYTLTEKTAPRGYALSESMTFAVTDSREVQKVIMESRLTEVTVVKKSSVDGSVLIGAKLKVQDEEGNLIDRWTSDKKPYVLTGLAVGIYTITEEKAPAGFVTAADMTFTITDSLEVQNLEVSGTPTTLQLHVLDSDTEKELPGAAIEIRNAKGKAVRKGTSKEKAEIITGLPVGTYTMVETGVPSGYAAAASMSFTIADTADVQDVTLYNQVTQVEISLQDKEGELLPGGVLIIKDAAGKELQKWTSDEEPKMIRKLPKGKYMLTELTAPAGFVRAESVSFKVTSENEVVKVRMENKPSVIEISKKDLTNSKMLSGAKLALQDSKGRTIEEWTSGEKPHLVEKLAIGDYMLTEKAAPKGYEVADQMYFTVEDTEEMQTFTMYNKPKEGTTSLIGKKTGTTTSLTGTSSLTGTILKGTTSLTGTVENKSASPVKTGDNTPLAAYIIVFIIAGVVLLLGIYVKKRKMNEK